MSELAPFQALDILKLDLEHERVGDDQRIAAEPCTGAADITSAAGAEIGVWEMTAGSMRDIEADEFFVVVAGVARVELLEGDRVVAEIELRPGVACRLVAGMSTRWHVTDPLRKIYALGAPALDQEEDA